MDNVLFCLLFLYYVSTAIFNLTLNFNLKTFEILFIDTFNKVAMINNLKKL